MLLYGTSLYKKVKDARVNRQLKLIGKFNQKKKKQKSRADALRAREPWG